MRCRLPCLARLFPAALLLASLACGPATAKVLRGVVSHVTDGDTLWVRPARGAAPVPVRIHGIDAPEICQPFGKQARAALAARVLRRQVQVTTRASDIHERQVGRVRVRGQDLGAWLVAGGYAWSSQYSKRAGPYANEEAQARHDRRGLWATRAIEPRLFRKHHGSCGSSSP